MSPDPKELARQIVATTRGRSAAGVARQAIASLRPPEATASPQLARAGEDGAPGRDGKDGETGPEGPEGPPGPMPAHRWEGTALQFEQAPGGEWGKSVDLKGDPGRDGAGGGTVIVGGGPGSGSVNSYFPSGW